MGRRITRVLDGRPPGSPAICHAAGEITYGELTGLVDRIAKVPVEGKCSRGDRIAIVAENDFRFVAAFLGVIKSGACAVPVNARANRAEIEDVLLASGARCALFVTAGSHAARDHAARYDGIAEPIEGIGLAWLTSDADIPEAPPEDVAAIVYTSGTTGKPKGVMLSHRSLLYNAEQAAAMRGMTDADTLLLALPCTHIMALSSCILATLAAGARLHLLERFSPAAMLDGLAGGATIMPAAPVMYDQMLAYQDATGACLVAPRLRQIGSGGAALDPSWKERVETIFGLPLHNSYGMTEAGPGITSTMFGPRRMDTSVGHAFPGCVLRIARASADGVGELECSGPNLMSGYFRDPEATAAAITPDGFLKTGDLARIDADGAVHIVGRAKEMIVRSGFNVYPAEVEAVLSRCPGVRLAAVAGRRIVGNEEIVAFLILDPGCDVASVRTWCSDHLTAYKRPQHLVQVDAMPLTAAGKVRKRDLLAEHEGASGTGQAAF